MENASKALLMAAGVLIGILILSLGIYLFASFASTSAEMHKENAKQQIDQFNSQFTSYAGKEGITIYDVVTLANLATETNAYYEFEKRTAVATGDDYYISVKLINSSLSGYTGGTIEKGYVPNKAVDNTDYYNNLIQLDLNYMQNKIDETGTMYKALTEYKCEVKISPTTRKSLSSNFSKEIVEKSKIKIYNR